MKTGASGRAKVRAGVIAAGISAVAAILVALINSRLPDPGPYGGGGNFTDSVRSMTTPPTPVPPTLAQDAQPRFPFELEQEYLASGWMGDGEGGERYVTIEHLSADVQRVQKIVVKVSYRPGPLGWAGVYWQHPPDNWGDRPGLDLSGAREISFLARGERGGEIVRFKSGGIRRGAHPDRFEAGLPPQILTTEWQSFRIDLSREDLSNVVGGFAWVAESTGDPVTFFLADLTVK